MKKFALNAVAFAAGVAAAGGALAGTLAPVGGPHNFAVESLSPIAPLTPVTTPDIRYTMGVGRPNGNGFTIIMAANAGSTFGTCVIPTPAFVARTAPHVNPTLFVTLKRSGVELSTGLYSCVYDVQVTVDDMLPGDTFTWVGQQFATHALATVGNTISVSMNLKDPGETAQVDNPGPITSTMATSGNALTLSAPQDKGTTTDVNNPNGPLFGFLPQNNDTQSTATANFFVGNNSGGTTFVKPDGVTPWNFVTDGTAINVTIAGDFTGMAANGLTVSNIPGPVPAVSGTGGTRTFTLLPANIHGGVNSVSVSFLSSQTVSLGTSRTFGVSAVGDVITGADDALAGNASWWVWGANASQLVTPYFNTNTNYITRFFFLNTSNVPVGYTAQCFTEGGGAVTNGAPGTLAANATTNLTASNVCTFPAAVPRGGVIFTINAPIEKIKGTYQSILKDGTSSNTVELHRPYTQQQTTE